MTMKSSLTFLMPAVAVAVMFTPAMAQQQVTFTKDVAPILQQHCQACHREGTIAPMSLLTYEQTRPWAKSIKAKVIAREMPPWFIDKNVGIRQFNNDISLTDQEIATLVKWADAGAPQGNPADMPPQGVFLDEYAIGKGPDVFKDGSGRYITAGTKINFEFHLHSNGTETPVNVLLGLKFYPKGYTPKYTVTSMTMGSRQVDLRPHEANVRSDGYLSLIKPARLLSFQPHMHTRGKAECIEAIYPNGKIETLSCARFEFNWMNNYVYADDAAPLLPAGTILHTIMWHDNSSENRNNPDPDAQITYGLRTVDEMSSAWLSYYYMSEEEFKKELAERKAKQQTLTSQR